MSTEPNLAAGRTRRNIDELKNLARDCGWQLVSIRGDGSQYQHPDSPGEQLDIPGDHYTGGFAERFDAALARLTPLPEPEPLPSRGLARQLIAAVTAQNAQTASGMCHWAQGRGDARSQSHHQFHFGDQPGQSGVCPYEVVAAVLTGRPDPRDAPHEYPVAGHPVDPDDDPFTRTGETGQRP